METLDENAAVISASKVTGTNVYNTDGDHLGEIYDVMLDKRSGNIAYAVMSFGGFLGIGERYHALPWQLSSTIPDRAAMWSVLPLISSKKRPPTPPMTYLLGVSHL